MKCQNIHPDLIYYLDNELSKERMLIVQEHLEKCADCRAFLALLKSEMQIIEQEKNPEVSPFFYTRLSAKLEEKPVFGTSGQWVRILQPAFFSLILLVGIYGGFKLGNNASTSTITPKTSNSIQMMNDFEAEPIESFLLEKL